MSGKYKLTVATPDEEVIRDRLQYEAWGPPLSTEDFAVRNLKMRYHPWCARDMTTWALRLHDEKGSEIVASCETLRQPSFLDQKPGWSPVIASVFVEPRFRKRGFASVLMSELIDHHRSPPPGSPVLRDRDQLQAITLYSVVGEHLYGRAGYKAVPSYEWIGKMTKTTSSSAASFGDSIKSEKDVKTFALDQPLPDWLFVPPTAPFVIWPSAEIIDWHLFRETFYCEKLGVKTPPSRGAWIDQANWCIWMVHAQSDTLRILTGRSDSPSSTYALLRTAILEGGRLGLGNFQVWEDALLWPHLESELAKIQTLHSVTRSLRDHDLAMALPFGPRDLDWRAIQPAIWA